MRRLSLTLALLLLLPVGVLVPAAASVAATPPTEPAQRLLVFSVPYVTWADVTAEDTPNLWRFLSDAAVANLATKVTRKSTRTGEAYATVGAVGRAVVQGDDAALAFQPDEPYRAGTAGQEYERRVGLPLTGMAGLLTLPDLQESNDPGPFGNDVGTVGQALRAARIRTGVVANADVPDPDPTTQGWTRHREALTALMDDTGQVTAGRVDGVLLTDVPQAPGGVRLDRARALGAFREAWRGRAAVLVEASDLVRAHETSPNTDAEAADAQFASMLRGADRLFGDLLREVDPSRDAVLVMAPTPPGPTTLTVFGLRAPGVDAGLLESGQTRRAGFLMLADTGATILDLLGVQQPEAVEGQPATVAAAGRSWADLRSSLLDAQQRAEFRDDLVEPFSTGYTVSATLFVAAAALFLLRGWRARRLVPIGLFLVAVLPMTYLSAILDTERLGDSGWLAFVLVGAAALTVAAWVVGRGGRGTVAILLGANLGTIVVSVAGLGSAWQLSTVFGDSPILAGRFTGVNNLTFAQLAVDAIMLAALAVEAWPGRRGRSTAVAVLVAVMLVDVLPMWGADVGGTLTLVPAFAATVAVLFGWRIRWRTVVVWGLATLAAVVALGFFDLQRPSDQRSHLGRLFERIGADGPAGLWLVVHRKLDQNLRALSSPWTVLVLVTVVVVLLFWWRKPELLQALRAGGRPVRAAGLGLATAAVVGLALNDSGIAIPGMMLVIVNPVVLHRLVMVCRPDRTDAEAGADEPFAQERTPVTAAVRR